MNAFNRQFQFGELNMDVITKKTTFAKKMRKKEMRKKIKKWSRKIGNPGKIVTKHNYGLMACTDVRIKSMLLENRKSGALSTQT